MRILTAESMREVDRAAIEELGLPSLVLMENAAIGVAEAIGARFPAASSAAIFCGPGNNGGDGLALARHLAARGYGVEVVLTVSGSELRGDAARQWEICRRQGLPIHELERPIDRDRVAALCRDRDLVVDALFGTGLARPLEGDLALLVEALNDSSCPRVAVDLPSGLSGSRHTVPGPHVQADLTVTFAAPKIPHVFPPAAAAVGEVVVADLGIPRSLLEAAPGDLRLATAEELAPLVRPRAPDSHKGVFGHLLVVAGSVGKAGAAVLATRAAMRTGVGLVTAAVPEALAPVVATASLESMTLPLPASSEGGLGAAALDRLREAREGKQALAVGPGLGLAATTVETVRSLVLETEMPVVLDADGLNAFAGRLEELAGRPAATVLTPHPMELARLLGTAKDEILADRPEAVRRAVGRSGAVVVLKGHLTLVGDPEGEIAVNPTGNPGMATGGSGDVLTGMIAALAAQGHQAADAARLGVFLHGLAGDLATGRCGPEAVCAGDLLDEIGAAFAELDETLAQPRRG